MSEILGKLNEFDLALTKIISEKFQSQYYSYCQWLINIEDIVRGQEDMNFIVKCQEQSWASEVDHSDVLATRT